MNVFPEKELRALSPNFNIFVFVSNLYIHTFSPPIFLQQNRQTNKRNIKIAQRNMNGGIGTVYSRAVPFLGIFVSNFRYFFYAVYGTVFLEIQYKVSGKE
jgi:hypothetical protein